MNHIESAEAAGGRLGAALAAGRSSDATRLSPAGPWLATTPEQARRVLTDPAAFDFPGHVGRGTDLSGSQADTRSGHHVFAPTAPDDVARGMAVFAAEWDRAVADATSGSPRGAGSAVTIDAMQLLRHPVARATCAAVLGPLDDRARDRVEDLVLDWIDALGPVIAARRPPRRFSRARRRELRTSAALEDALTPLGGSDDTPQVLATMLAAGIQVPIAAGAWLLAWLAAHPQQRVDPTHAVWESLRLTPPTWVTARIAVRDVRLGEQDVAAGELVLVSPLVLGRRSDLVPGTDELRDSFDPDRWADEQVRPGAWLPFGAGPHACPGRTLGLAMLRHVATWAGDHPLGLAEPVRVDQSRGIFPAPALVALSTAGGAG